MEFASPETFLSYIEDTKNDAFDLLITDFRMGKVSGIDMVMAAKKKNKDIPFILLSGFLDKEATLAAHNLGAHKILEKPIKIESLESEVKKLIIYGQIKELQQNNKVLFGKLKELCGLFDMFVGEHASAEEISDFFMQVHSAEDPKEKMDFNQYIRSIEDQAYRSIKTEDVLLRELKKEAS